MIKKKILAAYEEMAENYSRLIEHKPHNAYYDRPNTLSLIPEIKGKSILDAACGPGKYAEILMGMGATVTGIDLSPKMIRFAKERNRDIGTFFVHDLANPLFMFEDESFDGILCALALHYLEDWNPTIKEFRRVLKPDGFLVISLEHPFFEYIYFHSKKYFEVEPVSCIWNGFGDPIEVYSYRRSLQGVLSPLTDNGFYIDRLLEPTPTKEFEERDPEYYDKLMEFPAFMCVRAVPRNDIHSLKYGSR